VGRAVIVSSLEAATSYMLQYTYGQSTSTIGFDIAIMFVFSVPVLAAFAVRSITLSTAVVFVWCLNAVPLLGYSWTGANGSFWLIIAMDCLLFSFAYAINGVLDGMAITASVPDSIFTSENVYIMRSVTTNAARMVGPPLARFLLSNFSTRNPYILVVLGFVTLQNFSFTALWWRLRGKNL
jgi:hypothetical protein